MHLDQLIRALQHPACIDAAEAANKEVVFVDTKLEKLSLGLVTYNSADDKVYIGVMPEDK